MLGLSGGNVLAFLSICQHIWDAWLRSIAPENLDNIANMLPTIDNPNVQTEGVEKASAEWYRKVRHDPGGDTRRRFLDCLGEYLRDKLRQDKNMSYPGSNGFSLSNETLDAYPVVRDFLEEIASYGVLIELPHTPKNAGSGRRTKWYLSPILCPYFQIPFARTKEPIYVDIGEVRKWLEMAEVVLSPPLPVLDESEKDDMQLRLFDESKRPDSQ